MDAEHTEVEHTEHLLMLRGETRHCTDCGTATIFLPVEEHGWVCTACDAAVVLPDVAYQPWAA